MSSFRWETLLVWACVCASAAMPRARADAEPRPEQSPEEARAEIAIDRSPRPFEIPTVFGDPGHCITCHARDRLFDHDPVDGASSYAPLEHTLFELLLAFRDEHPRHPLLDTRAVSNARRKVGFRNLGRAFRPVRSELSAEQTERLEKLLRLDTEKRRQLSNWVHNNLKGDLEPEARVFVESLRVLTERE